MDKVVFNNKEVHSSEQTVQWLHLNQGNNHEMLQEKGDCRNESEQPDSL